MRRDHTKYLGLIEAITLLHQYQRPVREVEQRGEKLRYIEVTRGDIELANRLAHEVLGRSLDELPPQTRRLLGLVDELVGAESKRQGLDRCDTRFSRRQLRDFAGWGDTQLKVHLGRLVELEYLLVHRGRHSQRYEYELVYESAEGSELARLSGLADAKQLGNYDENRSGQKANRSGGGRGVVGPRSGGGRGEQTESRQEKTPVNGHRQRAAAETSHRGNGAASSYARPVVAARRA